MPHLAVEAAKKTWAPEGITTTQVFVYPAKLDQANDDGADGDGNGDEDGPIEALMFVFDAPGYSPLPTNPATRIALRFDFDEFVRVRFDCTKPSGDGINGSRASGKEAWQSLLHIEKVGGIWKRALTYDQIGPGNADSSLPE